MTETERAGYSPAPSRTAIKWWPRLTPVGTSTVAANGWFVNGMVAAESGGLAPHPARDPTGVICGRSLDRFTLHLTGLSAKRDHRFRTHDRQSSNVTQGR